MKSYKKTQLRHIMEVDGKRELKKINIDENKTLFYFNEKQEKVKVPRVKCSKASDIDGKTKILHKRRDNEERIPGVNDFGYPNWYWD